MTDTERRDLALRLFGTGRPGEPGPLNPGWVERRLAGTRQTLSRWRKVGIPPDRLEEVLDAIREALDLPSTTKEAAPPEWAERLLEKMDAIAASQRIVADEAVDRAIAALAPASSLEQADALNRRLEELLRLRGAESPEQSAAEDPAGVEPQEQRGE